MAARRKSVWAEPYDPSEDQELLAVVYPKTDEERRDLERAVLDVPLLRGLDEDPLRKVIDAMQKKNVKPGECVIRQGDDGDFFYVIQTGTFDTFITTNGAEKKVFTYNNSGCFGELALLYNKPRAATVTAKTNGQLWMMDRLTFRKIVVQAAHQKRKQYEKLLSNVDILSSLNVYERDSLCDALKSYTYREHEIIVRQGDEASGMYFIEEGKCRVTISKASQEQEVATLHDGQYFGELALLTKRPRAASVYAVNKVKVAFLDVGAFERLLGNCLDIMKRNVKTYRDQCMRSLGCIPEEVSLKQRKNSKPSSKRRI